MAVDGFVRCVGCVCAVLVEDCHGRWDDGECDGLQRGWVGVAQLEGVRHNGDWFAVDVHMFGCDGDVCVWCVGHVGVLLGCGVGVRRGVAYARGWDVVWGGGTYHIRGRLSHRWGCLFCRGWSVAHYPYV